MKKNLLTVIFICFAVLSSVNANAGDVVRPPKDLKGLIGKVLTLSDSDSSNSNTFMCSVTGVSEYLSQMGRQVTLSVAGLNHYEEEIKTIDYIVTFNVEGWEVKKRDKKQKITVISIE